MKKFIPLILPMLLLAHAAEAAPARGEGSTTYAPDVGPDVIILKAQAFEAPALVTEDIVLTAPQGVAPAVTVFVAAPRYETVLFKTYTEKEVFRLCRSLHDTTGQTLYTNSRSLATFHDGRYGNTVRSNRPAKDIRSTRYRRG